MMWLYIILGTPILVLIITSVVLSKKKAVLLNKHVVITGGSSGIGEKIALLSVIKGAHVTIIARNLDRLKQSEERLKKSSLDDHQIITAVSADVSNYSDIKKKLLEVEELVGPIFMLVNCAGFAQCGNVEDFSPDIVKQLVDVNYLGTLYPTQVLLPKFKERKEGIIVLTGSQASLVGIYGYSVYSSCKFALRGLAEALNMEVKPYNISVTLALPPDTDTPGFENENKSKPHETQLISSTGGLYKPEDVAARILDDALNGRFFSIIGFESFILTTLCVGMTPLSTIWDLVVQIVLMGPLRAISLIYLHSFNTTIYKCYIEKQSNKDN